MQTRVTIEEMQAAARQLARSESGRRSIKRLLDVLPDDDVRLGLIDRAAFSALLQAAWDGHAGDVRKFIGDALTGHPVESQDERTPDR